MNFGDMNEAMKKIVEEEAKRIGEARAEIEERADAILEIMVDTCPDSLVANVLVDAFCKKYARMFVSGSYAALKPFIENVSSQIEAYLDAAIVQELRVEHDVAKEEG